MRYQDCERCGAPGRNFVEIYDPLRQEVRTHHLCDDCQFDLKRMVDFFIMEGKA